MEGVTRYLVEFIGTLIFLLVILRVTRKDSSLGPIAPIAIVIGLLVSIWLFGDISGGHFNPAVSVMFLLKDGSGELVKTIGYIVAQVLGGAGALAVHNFLG